VSRRGTAGGLKAQINKTDRNVMGKSRQFGPLPRTSDLHPINGHIWIASACWFVPVWEVTTDDTETRFCLRQAKRHRMRKFRPLSSRSCVHEHLDFRSSGEDSVHVRAPLLRNYHAITEGAGYAEANANSRQFAQHFRPRQQVFACEQSFAIHRRTGLLDGQRTAALNGSFAAVFVCQ
jgi:hypothetical protein